MLLPCAAGAVETARVGGTPAAAALADPAAEAHVLPVRLSAVRKLSAVRLTLTPTLTPPSPNPNPSPSPNPNPNPNPTLTLTLTLTRCDARSLEEVPTFASVAEQLEALLPAGLPGAGAP